MYNKQITPMAVCQLKFAEGDQGMFSGYASVYGHVDSVKDTIAPGAFAESLESGKNIKMFVNHDSHAVPIGDWETMKEDNHGLYAEGRIDLNHKDGPTVYSALKRGAMDGLSIGFTMDTEDFDVKEDGGRIIKNANLMEVSLVNFPCEGKARIMAVKADLAVLSSLKDCEDYLREAGGFSKSMATALVSHILKVSRGEPEAKDNEITRILGAEMRDVINSLKNRL